MSGKPNTTRVRKPKKAPALLCAHPTTVHAPEQTTGQVALLEEVSAVRATLSLDCPLRKGDDVRIDCGSCELRGRVAGCREWEPAGGYLAHVRLAKGYQWDPDVFRPDHLFNPNSVSCANPGCTPECVSGSCLNQSKGTDA